MARRTKSEPVTVTQAYSARIYATALVIAGNRRDRITMVDKRTAIVDMTGLDPVALDLDPDGYLNEPGQA